MRNQVFLAALRRARSENGQVLIIAALCLTVLLGFVAFATDVGMLLHEKRILQTAADSAAIAGAAQLGNAASKPGGGATHCNTNNDNCWYYAALADAAQNGVPTSAVTPKNPPSVGPNSGSSAYVEVIITQPQPTFLAGLFGFSTMSAAARAVATNVPTTACIWTLSSAAPGTNGPGGVDLTGGADLDLPNCGILDNATGAFAFHMTGGTTLTAASIGVSGTDTIHNGADLNGAIAPATPSPAPVTGMATVSDPLASVVTVPPASDYSSGCTAQSYGTGNYTIGPSTPTGYVCYSSFTVSNGSPNITLNPGLYIITGSMNIGSGGTLTGSDVTFYFVNNGSFSLSNGVTADLSAPTSGAYNGLLFYQASSDTNADSFVGGNSGTTNGIFYLPTANLTLANGTSAVFNVDIVVGSLSMSGAATLRPYKPLIGASPLSSAALVE